MKYDHVMKYNGEYYKAGEEVPIGEPLQNTLEEELPFSNADFEEAGYKYAYEELEEMTAKEIRKIAEESGIKITKALKDDIINEFLSKQG